MFSGVMFRRNEGQIISWLFFLYIPLLSWASIDRYSFPHRETIFDTPVDAYMYVSTGKVTDTLTSLTVEDTSTNSEENKQVGLFPCGPHLEPAVTTCCRPEWGLQMPFVNASKKTLAHHLPRTEWGRRKPCCPETCPLVIMELPSSAEQLPGLSDFRSTDHTKNSRSCYCCSKNFLKPTIMDA